MNEDKIHLGKTLQLAQESLDQGGFPVGALIVSLNGKIFTGLSLTETSKDVTHHAEVAAIRAAQGSLGGTLYSSLEPCVMCLSACVWAGIYRVVFACPRSLVDSSYYETSLTSKETAAFFTNKPEVLLIPGLETQTVALIKEYERRKVGGEQARERD